MLLLKYYKNHYIESLLGEKWSGKFHKHSIISGASIACGPSSLSSNPFGAGGVFNMDSGTSSLGNLAGMMMDDRDRSSFDKEFECSVCLDEMRPPTKIFQCKNGHVMCEACKNHTEVSTCPTCR